MEQFIILGLVPGTDVQISFGLVATVAGYATLAYLIRLLVKEHRQIKRQITDFINSITI